VSSVYAAVEPCLVQSCAPSGGCADGERRVGTEFVGTGNGVLADVCGNVRLCCTHVCFCMGCAWDANPRVHPGVSCFRMLYSDGNSASQARGRALDPAPRVHRLVQPA
jgi:hypothetical protein